MSEGDGGNPLNELEALNAMKNMAKLTRSYYAALRDEGFRAGEALQLTTTWLRATVSGVSDE